MRTDSSARNTQQDPRAVRWILTLAAVTVLVVLVVIPVANVFYQALANGIGIYLRNLFDDPYTRHAILLTVTVASVAVACNVVFGVAAAWALARFARATSTTSAKGAGEALLAN